MKTSPSTFSPTHLSAVLGCGADFCGIGGAEGRGRLGGVLGVIFAARFAKGRGRLGGVLGVILAARLAARLSARLALTPLKFPSLPDLRDLPDRPDLLGVPPSLRPPATTAAAMG